MFLGMSPGAPEPGIGDEGQLKRIEKKVDRLADVSSGKADYAKREANDSPVFGADPYNDIGALNRTEGEEYGSADPTGREKKQQIEDTAKIAESSKKTEEALADVREQIKKMQPNEHSEEGSDFLGELKDAA